MSATLWVVMPYVAATIFIAGHVWRWRTDQFGWTSHTSQLLENRLLRLGSPLFHLGVFMAIGGHVLGLLVPASWTAAIGIPERAYHVVSVTAGTIAGTMVVTGLVLLLARRFANPRIRLATTAMDKVLFAVMTVTTALGMAETVGVNLLGGGYSYRDTVSVWFRGIYLLHPDGQLMAHAPLAYQMHVISALAFIALWPFTRLVHVWSAPVAYLWRPYIVYRRRPAAPARVPAARGHRGRPRPATDHPGHGRGSVRLAAARAVAQDSLASPPGSPSIRAANLLVQAESKPDSDLPRKDDLMTGDEPLRETPRARRRGVSAANGTLAAAEPGEAGEGGDPACWACLVCQECGAVISEGHRAGCSRIAIQPTAGDSTGGNGRAGVG